MNRAKLAEWIVRIDLVIDLLENDDSEHAKAKGLTELSAIADDMQREEVEDLRAFIRSTESERVAR